MSDGAVRRVLFCESSANVGGQELQMLTQAVNLPARGIDTLLLCRPNGRVAAEAAARGVATRPIPFRNSFHLPSIAGVRKVIAEFRPDAVVCHSGHDANTGALAARLVAKRPVLLRARTYQHGVPGAWSYNTLFDRTLVPSLEMRELLLANRRIDPKRIHVLYVGMDFDAIARRSQEALPEATARALAELPQPLIVQAAMLRPEKGHALMLDALARLKAEGLVAGFAIAGEGEMKVQLQAQVQRLGLGDQVRFLGLVDNVPALIRRASLVVVPSSYEPLGMTQIEALSLEVPVIASDVGGIPETVRHETSGLLVPPQDPAAWVAAIRRALESPAGMKAMAGQGRADVLRRFGLQTNLDQLINHIQSCRRPHR